MLTTNGSAVLPFEEPVAGLASLHRVEQLFWKPGAPEGSGVYGDLLLFADTPKQQVGALLGQLALPTPLAGLELNVRVWRVGQGTPATQEQLQGPVSPYPPLDAELRVFHGDSSLIDFSWQRLHLASVHLHRQADRWQIFVLFNDRSPVSVERILRSLIEKFIDAPTDRLDVTIYKGKLRGNKSLVR